MLNIFWDDEDPQVVLDVSAFVPQAEDQEQYGGEGEEYAEEYAEGVEEGYPSAGGTTGQEEAVEGSMQPEQAAVEGYEPVGAEEENYQQSLTKAKSIGGTGASQLQQGYEEAAGAEEENYEPSAVAPTPKTVRGRSKRARPGRKLGRGMMQKRAKRAKRPKVSKSSKSMKRPLSRRPPRRKSGAATIRRPLKRGAIGKRPKRSVSKRPKRSTKRMPKRAKSKSVGKSAKSAKSRRPRRR